MNIVIPPVSFTPVGIAAIAGLVLAATFAWIPVFRVWYAGLLAGYKSLIMLGVTLATGAVITLLIQLGVITATQPVTWSTYVATMLMFIIVNQPVFMILPQPVDVQVAVLKRNMQVLTKYHSKIYPQGPTGATGPKGIH
jgi:hypothetical protein